MGGVAGGQFQIGKHFVSGLADAEVVDVEILHGGFQVGTGGQGFDDLFFGVDGRGIDFGADGFGELDGQEADFGIEIRTHLAAEGVFGLLERVLSLRDADFGGGELLLGIEDIEGGKGAEFQFTLGAFEGLLGEVAGAYGDAQVFAGEDTVPISVFGIADQLQQGGMKVEAGFAEAAGGEGDGEAVDVCAAILKQGLGNVEGEAGVEHRIVIIVAAVGEESLGEEAGLILEPGGEGLAVGEVGGLGGFGQSGGAGDRGIAGDGALLGIAEAGGGEGVEDGEGAGDGVLGDVDGQALDGDVGIVGHDQFEIGAHGELELVADDEFLQAGGGLQLDVSDGASVRLTEIGWFGE